MTAFVYTDGACSNNGRKNAKAGIGVYFGEKDDRNISERIDGLQTNNRAELSAVIAAYHKIKPELDLNKEITIVTDSNYVIKCVGSYGEKCFNNNWSSSTKTGIPNVDLLKDFADERNPYMWQMLMASFQINETVNVSIGSSNGGGVLLAGVQIKKSYSGKHFKNVPMVVRAIPLQGYEFVGWKGDARKEASIQIVPSQNIALTPIFRKIS